MFRPQCTPHQENLAAYSLGALDVEEIAALESHLETCEDCQGELADYRKIATGLLYSLPPRTPLPRLRNNLMGKLPSARSRTSGLSGRFLNRLSPGQVATAAIMLVLLVLNIFSAIQIRDLQQGQIALAERLSTEQAAVALLAYPNTQVHVVNADVDDVAGSMLVDKDRVDAVLFLWNMPELESGQVYQVWLIDANGKRLSGGLFSPAGGQEYTTVIIESAVPLGEFVGIGVTVEPSGGSEQPTGSRVLAVDL
jgi:anti-sigma-K factor RskA